MIKVDLRHDVWPTGDYPNLLGLTRADRKPKLQGLRAECYFMDELDEWTKKLDKLKFKPPTFEEFCKGVKLNVMYNPATFCRTYSLTYYNNEVGNIIANIAVSEIDILDERIHTEDIQNAIDQEKLNMYTKLTQEYDKKNKEATIKEEKKMIYIPGMNEQEGRAIVDELKKISYSISANYEPGMMGCPPIGTLNLEIPFENVPRLKIAAPTQKGHWLEGIPAVKKVETYNRRVVKVTFIDDTFTKSVCSENDQFDIDVGITICLVKRFVGTNSDNATREYNRLMNHVHEVMDKNEKEKLDARAQKAIDKAKKRKIELKRAAKKLKAKEEQIDIQKQAIIRAHQEMEAME